MEATPSGAGAPEPFVSALPEPYRDLRRRLPVAATAEGERGRDVIRTHRAGEPELPEIHRADVLCVGPIMINSLYWLFGKPVTVALLASHLRILLALRPTITSLIAAGAAVHAGWLPLWFPLVVPLPIRFADDPFYYWAGRRYGNRLTSFLIQQDPRWEQRIARGERMMERWGFWAILGANTVIPIPAAILYFIAGDSRMSFKLFAIADIIGIEIYFAAVVAAGYALGNAATSAVNTIGQYSTYLFWGTIVMVVVYTVNSVRRSLRIMREQEAAASRGRLR